MQFAHSASVLGRRRKIIEEKDLKTGDLVTMNGKGPYRIKLISKNYLVVLVGGRATHSPHFIEPFKAKAGKK